VSAWVVGKEHIDLLVTAGLVFPGRRCQNSKLRWYGTHEGELDDSNADVIGGKLWAENYASVNDRYPDAAEQGGLPGPVGFEGEETLTYTLDRIPGMVDPVVVLKAIDCYVYQSCEHGGWATSEARAIVEALRSACIKILPGYDDAPWDFDDRQLFMKRLQP
jgi:hypothetical protein